MDGNPPVFFEGPEELMLSRQMLQLMGKELINVRAQLAESECRRVSLTLVFPFIYQISCCSGNERGRKYPTISRAGCPEI